MILDKTLVELLLDIGTTLLLVDECIHISQLIAAYKCVTFRYSDPNLSRNITWEKFVSPSSNILAACHF